MSMKGYNDNEVMVGIIFQFDKDYSVSKDNYYSIHYNIETKKYQ